MSRTAKRRATTYDEMVELIEGVDFTRAPYRGVYARLAKKSNYHHPSGLQMAVRRGQVKAIKMVANEIKRINDTLAEIANTIRAAS